MKEMISMINHVNLLLTTLFLIFGVGFFVHAAWKKKEEPKNTIGNLVSAYFLASALILIWG